MTIEEAKKYYGSYYAIARALGLTRQAIGVWKSIGHIPLRHQFKLEKMTGGKLKASIEDTNYK